MKNWEGLIAFICIAFCTGYIFQENVFAPSKLLLAGGDGTKNYFTFLYHVQHDSTYWKFEGMNYPFGENILFTDNQPVVANLVKYVDAVLPMSNETLIAIHNLVLFLGLALGGLGIFLVLRKLGTGSIFALACTLGLMLLQPQIQRFNSHYSMTYPVLPWVFYLWLLIRDSNRKWLPSLIIGILATVFGLIHMYHFLTIAVLCSLVTLFSVLQLPRRNEVIRYAGLFTLQVIVPFIIIFSVSNLVYPVDDRPQKVWGFFHYHSSWEGLLFSYKLPLFQFINQHLFKVRNLDVLEGVNYIGLVSVVFLLSFFIYGFLRLKKLSGWRSTMFSTQGTLAFVFILSGLISFGFPFTIKGFEWLLEYTGPFQQFRSIGRVGWISFYAINFLAIPVWYKLAANQKRPLVKWFIWLFVPLIIFWEGYNSKPVMTNPPHLAQAFQTSEVTWPFQPGDYQAILPDPYLHAGSECFSWPHVGLNQDQAFEIGMQSGLPGLATVLSRTSLSQAVLLNQLVCQPYDVPEIIQILKKKDPRPILVLESKLELYNYNSSVSHWTKGTPVVFENNEYKLRSLPLNHFDTIVKQWQDSSRGLQMDTLLSEDLDFQLLPKDNVWGFEAIHYCDSLKKGEAKITFEILYKENTDINSITEVWQITRDHQNAEQFSVRNNYHYKRIKGDRLFIEIPLVIKPETDKIAIRIYKDRQTKRDPVFFSNPKIVMVSKKLPG